MSLCIASATAHTAVLRHSKFVQNVACRACFTAADTNQWTFTNKAEPIEHIHALNKCSNYIYIGVNDQIFSLDI